MGSSEKWTTEAKCNYLLAILSDGRPHSTSELLSHDGRNLGHRFACPVSELRARGYIITTTKDRSEGVGGAWYQLIANPLEPLVSVTMKIRDAYYATEHWKGLSRNRREFDGWQCTRCKTADNLNVHHWRYPLFEETLLDLQTYCWPCHQFIHQQCGIAFPKYIADEIYERILNERTCDDDKGPIESDGPIATSYPEGRLF